MIHFASTQLLLMAIKGGNGRTFFSFSLFIIFIGLCYSQTDELQQGRVLKDGNELVSAFGNFRLGFFSPFGTTSRHLGIWYHRPRDLTDPLFVSDGSIQPVWVANRNNPIFDKSASLAIDSNDGNLKILQSKGNPIAVSSVQAKGNTSATLDKSGNFILNEVNSNGTKRRVLWQSFDYPTDTLLPGMKLGIDLQTGHRWFLRSWSTKHSPADGAYTLGLDINNTNQLVIWGQEQVYWRSGIWLNGYFNSSSSVASYYNFSYMATEKEIYFSYSVNDDVTEFPALQISPRGDLIDNEGGLYMDCILGGCSFKILECRRDFYYFVTKKGFISGDGFKFKKSDNMTSSECEAKCFNNCSCVAFATTNRFNDTGCEMWGRGSNFTESFTGDYREINMEYVPKEKKWWLPFVAALAVAVTMILLCSLCYQTGRNNKSKKNWWISLTIAVGTALLVPLLCYLCYLIWRTVKAKVKRIMNRQKLLRELGDNASLPTIFGTRRTRTKDPSMKRDLMIFDFQTIAVATDYFSTANRLGQGGFGPVYKGKLLDGQEIAIKRLSKSSGQGIIEFKNEAKLIAKLQHMNLVTLLGCSLQGGERLLVYEYMPNKSLDYFIFNSERKLLLNWTKRFNIIEGIAQGLIYLHKYSRLRVIHRDLKASNILLDDRMNPKISDFGMAKTFAMNELEANTNRIVGTHGYMPPEYVMNGIVSMKSDVYSFGVLILEIISSKKNNSSYDTERPLNLVGYAWQLWNEGKGLELIDPSVGESCSPNEVLRCIHVGLLCVQDRATDRPTMSDVVSMFTNDTMALPAPKQPAFFINIAPDQVPEVTEIKLEVFSVNDVTISGMEAR